MLTAVKHTNFDAFGGCTQLPRREGDRVWSVTSDVMLRYGPLSPPPGETLHCSSRRGSSVAVDLPADLDFKDFDRAWTTAGTHVGQAKASTHLVTFYLMPEKSKNSSNRLLTVHL